MGTYLEVVFASASEERRPQTDDGLVDLIVLIATGNFKIRIESGFSPREGVRLAKLSVSRLTYFFSAV